MIAFVRNGDRRLALERRGFGASSVLFVHGWISSRRMWYDVADALDPSRFSAYLLDFHGHGLSDRPAAGYDLDAFASDLHAALAAIDGPVTVVAHSMGGKVAQYVALDPPATFARALLVAPGAARSVRMPESHRAQAEEAFGSRERIERFQRAAMAREVPAETVERLVDDALVASREAWFGWYDRGRTADFAARLGEVRMPVLVLGGDRDPLARTTTLRRDVCAPLGAPLVTLRGVGHNLPVEAAVEVAAAVERFVP